MISEADEYAFLIRFKDSLQVLRVSKWVIEASHVVMVLGRWITGTFVDGLLTQRVEFKLVEHLKRLFFLLIFQLLRAFFYLYLPVFFA